MAAGASGDEIACFTRLPCCPVPFGVDTLRRLGDLSGAQAPCADPDSFGGPVHDRPHGLQVRLEPARPDIMGVRNRPADNRTLIADFATLRHEFLCSFCCQPRLRPADPVAPRRGQPLPRPTFCPEETGGLPTVARSAKVGTGPPKPPGEGANREL